LWSLLLLLPKQVIAVRPPVFERSHGTEPQQERHNRIQPLMPMQREEERSEKREANQDNNPTNRANEPVLARLPP
jgi:hypothetical protein